MTTTTQQSRYHLPAKSIKSDCPQCGPRHRKTLSRYIDSRTGEALPDTYGRCDHESKCGYHLNPYHKSPSGMSYADAVYQQWKADQPMPARSDARRHTYRNTDADNSLQTRFSAPARQPHLLSITPSASEPVYCIPDEVFGPTVGHYKRNQFAWLLEQQFGPSVANGLLQRFQIGTSNHWPGACVFWLKDEHHRVRAGQVVLFAHDWHKSKYVDKEGTTKVCISSASHGLLRRCRKQGQTPPDWLIEYHQNAPRWPILFGLHQLATAPIDQPVAIVEAPKTAVVCSAKIPGFVWLAVGAMSYLNAERLAPLLGRKIMLFPDLNAYTDWSRRADLLRAEGFSVKVSDLLERGATDEQKAEGLDLADFLLDATPTLLPPWTLPASDWILSFPMPGCWDTATQLARIQWLVLPLDAE